MSRATEDALSELHGKLAEALAKKIEEGTASPSELSVARQFLKDNSITSDLGSDPKTSKLSDLLPDDIDDENVVPIYGS